MSERHDEPPPEDNPLKTLLRLGAGLINIYGAVAAVLTVAAFVYYLSFRGTDEIVFIGDAHCVDDLAEVLDSDPLRDRTLLVYTQTQRYPNELILQWHERLRQLQRDIDSDAFAVTYFAATPCFTLFAGETLVGKRYGYRRFVREHDLRGYHFTVTMPALTEFKSGHGMERFSSPLIWLIPASRDTVYHEAVDLVDTSYHELLDVVHSMIEG